MKKSSKSGEYEIQAGRVYRFSLRPELDVLDDKSPKGWTVGSFGGAGVSRVNEQNEVIESPVKGPEALKVGDRIVAPTLAGEVQATVGRDDVGDLCWISGGFVGDLEYDPDQGSWVTSIAINKKLLR